MDLVGRTLGSYRILSLLGEGGMGAVYLAEHKVIGRKAAIKILHPEFAAQPRVVERFFNEARAANQIRHPSIIEIYDFGQSPEVGAYFVMEFLEGESVAARLRRRGTLPPVEAVGLLARVASALAAAHVRGIIHRDIKPDNVFVVPDPDHQTGERIKVLDFGIAKLGGDGVGGLRTSTGAVMGTPVYMSPEQCHGAKNVDARSDVYSLGIIAYEALCGRPPFVADGFGELIGMHMTKAPAPPRSVNPHVPPALEAAVLRALEKDPDARYASMDEFSSALEHALTPDDAFAPTLGPGLASTLAPASAPGVRTTLSGTTGEVGSSFGAPSPAWRTRPAMLAVAALATVGLIAGGVAFFAGDDGADTRDRVSPDGARAKADETAPTARVEPAMAVESATVRVSIDSEPRGAEVYRALDRIRIGETPFKAELPRGPGEAVFVLHAEGYRDETVTVGTAADSERVVSLEPAKRRPKGKTTGPPKTSAPVAGSAEPKEEAGSAKLRVIP